MRFSLSIKAHYSTVIPKIIYTSLSTGNLFKDKIPKPLCSIVYNTSSCDGTFIGKTSRHLFMLNEEHKGVSLRYTNYRLTSPIKSTIRSHSELRNHSFSTEDFEILDSF